MQRALYLIEMTLMHFGHVPESRNRSPEGTGHFSKRMQRHCVDDPQNSVRNGHQRTDFEQPCRDGQAQNGLWKNCHNSHDNRKNESGTKRKMGEKNSERAVLPMSRGRSYLPLPLFCLSRFPFTSLHHYHEEKKGLEASLMHPRESHGPWRFGFGGLELLGLQGSPAEPVMG